VVPEWLENPVSSERFAQDIALGARVGIRRDGSDRRQRLRARGIQLRDVNISNPDGVSFAAFR